MIDIKDQLKRLEQAELKIVELKQEINKWLSTSPLNCKGLIDDDRLAWKLILTVDTEPDLNKWGLILGEAINHLRALLDNYIYCSCVNLGISDPKKLKLAQFPICSSVSDWKAQRNRIGMLPDDLQKSIECIQPFNRVSPKNDLLTILRELSNEDKHHIQIKPRLDPKEISNESGVEFESESEAAKNVPPNITISAPKFENGSELIKQTTVSKIVRVNGRYSLITEIVVIVPNLGPAPLTQTLEALCLNTKTVLLKLNS